MPCPEKFRDALALFKVKSEVVSSVLDGYEDLLGSAPKSKKAAFFKRAMDIFDAELTPEESRDILNWCACCKSGAREKNSKEFARINAGLPIEQKLEKIAKAPYMNMGRPLLEPDGSLLIHAVYYVYEDKYACGCSNFRRLKRDYPVSKTYCQCCGGHFKYHYEIMLGVTLEQCEVVSSPLDSNGSNPCVFRFKIRP